MITFIKEKDRIRNPEKYVARTEAQISSAVNLNLFDDHCDDVNSSDSGNDSDENMPTIIERKKKRQSNDITMRPESSFKASMNKSTLSNEKKLSLAEAREKLIDDELIRYANISRTEFSEFRSLRGLTRNDRLEPIG